jgi:hypothetical protein
MLEHAGFRVFTTVRFADAIHLTVNRHFDVVVLCQTLSAGERKGMLATTHAIHPPTRTLVLIEMEEEIPIPNVGMEDAVLEALEGPQTFLSVIDRMLWAILCFRRPLDSSPAFR